MKTMLGSLLGVCLAAAGYGQYLETIVPVGAFPVDVLWNPASNKVYTSNGYDASVTIIDGATSQVLGTVPVAGSPLALCWNSVGNKIYVTSSDPDWLHVVDGAGDTLIKKVRMRGSPNWVAFSATLNKLYVACYDDGVVRVYDGSADVLVAEVSLGSSHSASAILWQPTTNRVFCPTYCDGADRDTVYVIDCATDEIAARSPVGRQSSATCWNQVNNMVYVAAGDGVYVLSPLGDSIMGVVPAHATSVCFIPDPNKVFMAGSPVAVLDCDSNVVREIAAARAVSLISDTTHGKVYGANYYSESLYIMDARAESLVKVIGVGRYPYAMCWNSADNRVYIADSREDAVYIIRDTTTAITEDEAEPEMGQREPTTFVRDVLRLAEAASWLLDISGRKVLDLKSGANDVSRIPPGVYFVLSPHPNPPPSGGRMKERWEPSAMSRQPRAVTKVVLQR